MQTGNGVELDDIGGVEPSPMDTAGRLMGQRPPRVRSVTCRQHHDTDAVQVIPAHHPGSLVLTDVLSPGTQLATVASSWSREMFFLGLQGPQVKATFGGMFELVGIVLTLGHSFLCPVSP